MSDHHTTHLLYLHGFRSSPQSAKAQQVAARMRAQNPGCVFWCPQLAASPRAAMALVAEGIAAWPWAQMAVIGSSLGGFYASWVAAQTGCPVVLLNPAVNPARDLEQHIGAQTAWHDPDAQFFFRPEFIAELRALECPGQPLPAQTLAVIAQGDEVLDWREMRARYPGAQLRLLPASDHALSDFGQHIDAVFDFLRLR